MGLKVLTYKSFSPKDLHPSNVSSHLFWEHHRRDDQIRHYSYAKTYPDVSAQEFGPWSLEDSGSDYKYFCFDDDSAVTECPNLDTCSLQHSESKSAAFLTFWSYYYHRSTEDSAFSRYVQREVNRTFLDSHAYEMRHYQSGHNGWFTLTYDGHQSIHLRVRLCHRPGRDSVHQSTHITQAFEHVWAWRECWSSGPLGVMSQPPSA